MKVVTGSFVHWLQAWAWPVNDLKAMADDGQLTADKVVPALISQLGVLRDEYAAMPETVSDGITKVETPLWPGWVARMKPAG